MFRIILVFGCHVETGSFLLFPYLLPYLIDEKGLTAAIEDMRKCRSVIILTRKLLLNLQQLNFDSDLDCYLVNNIITN
jgi:hypothetical protein